MAENKNNDINRSMLDINLDESEVKEFDILKNSEKDIINSTDRSDIKSKKKRERFLSSIERCPTIKLDENLLRDSLLVKHSVVENNTASNNDKNNIGVNTINNNNNVLVRQETKKKEMNNNAVIYNKIR